jgi:hypothetical protein
MPRAILGWAVNHAELLLIARLHRSLRFAKSPTSYKWEV